MVYVELGCQAACGGFFMRGYKLYIEAVNKTRHELLASVRRRRQWSERIAAVVLVGIPLCALTQTGVAAIASVAVLGGLAGHLSFSAGTIFERVTHLRRGAASEETSN